MTHWYSADLHLSDDGIRRFFDRPFGDVAAMNHAVIERLAARLGADDDLWILGDVADSAQGGAAIASELLTGLPGRKHLIRGNHDDAQIEALPWTSIHDLTEVQDGPERFVLCHYPLLSWNGARQGAIQLFGHVHDRWAGSDRQVNVGVDLWDFAPVRAADIVIRAATLPPLEFADRIEEGG